MPTQPLVSVMIPTYKQAEYLPLTIESVLSQTYPNLEIVIADDCSPDSTAEVVSLFRSDPRVRYEPNRTNTGRVANYRRSLYSLSSGVYVSNLDGDDLLGDADYLRVAVEQLEDRDDADLCIGRVIRAENGHGVALEEAGTCRCSAVDGTRRFLRYWKDRKPIHHLGAVYRRSAAVDFYRRDIISSDTESLLRLLPGRALIECDMLAGFWRAHQDNASVNLPVEAAIQNLALTDSVASDSQVRRRLTNRQLRKWRFAMLRDRIYGSAVTHFLSKGRMGEGEQFLRQAVVRYPGPGLAAVTDPRLVLYRLSPRTIGRIKGRVQQ